MELELKHLKGYLDCGLQGVASFLPDTIFVVNTINVKKLRVYGETKFGNNVPIGCFFKEFKPLLYPLSSLTKEIEHDGERFVPSVEYSHLRFEEISTMQGGDRALEFIKVREQEILFELHLDYYGLIQAGLAIDKSTVNLKG